MFHTHYIRFRNFNNLVFKCFLLPLWGLGGVGFLFSGCQSIRELNALSKCQFRNKDFAKMEIAGVNILGVTSWQNMDLIKTSELTYRVAQQDQIPFTTTFNIEVKNDHDKMAALEQMDWILEVDNKDVINGTSTQRFEVPPLGTNILPITTTFDVKKILNKSTLDNIFALLQGNNEEDARIRLKIKPRFRIAGIRVGYPGYIKISKTFKHK